MKHKIGLLVFAFFTMGLFSCTSDDDGMVITPTPTTTTFTATLNGDNEVPPNDSPATGSATLTFNNTTKIFTLITTFSSGLTLNAAHVHKGAVGVSGPAVFPLSDLTSPINYTSVALTASQETDLKANLYYINLHTDAYPDGEIRGQLIKQ